MNLKKIIPTLAIIGLIAIIVILLIFNLSPKQNKSGFTELYFVGDLPKTVKTNEQYNFSFAIHNLEERMMIYNCIIYLNSTKVSQDYVFLDPDDIIVINHSFKVEKAQENLSLENISIPVSVQLLNKRQEIHFWALIK